MISPEVQNLLDKIKQRTAQPQNKPTVSPEAKALLDNVNKRIYQSGQKTTALGVAGREVAENVAPALTGLGGALIGGKTGAAVGTAFSPGIGTAIGAGVGAIGGYIAGEYGGAKTQRYLQELMMSPQELAKHDALMALGKQEHPYAAGMGSMAASVPGFFSGGGTGKAVLAGSKAVKASMEATKTVKVVSGIASSGTSFGAMGGGGVAVERARETPGAENLSIPKEVIKGIAIGSALGLVPEFKTVFGKFVAKPAADALALSTANGVYDRITEGKPFDPKEVIKESGQNIAPFVVMNIVGSVLHGRALAEQVKKPLEAVKTGEPIQTTPHTEIVDKVPLEPVKTAPEAKAEIPSQPEIKQQVAEQPPVEEGTKLINVYRGELAPIRESRKQISGIQDIGNLMGIKTKPPEAPFEFFTTDKGDAENYIKRDQEFVSAYESRFPDKGIDTFRTLHGHEPRTVGKIKNHQITPKKIFDLTKVGERISQDDMVRLVNDALGNKPLPEKLKWKDVPENVLKEMKDYGFWSVGGEGKEPTWSIFRNKMSMIDAELIKQGKRSISGSGEEIKGNLFAQWLIDHGYDAVKYLHKGKDKPIKHFVMVRPDLMQERYKWREFPATDKWPNIYHEGEFIAEQILPPPASRTSKATEKAAETPVSGVPETTDILTPKETEVGELPLEKSAAQIANELVQSTPTSTEAKSVGAAALNKLELATTTFAEPGEKKLRGIIKLVEDSPIFSEETKTEVKKLDPEYEQQHTNAMAESVYQAMKEDPNLAVDAEKFIRDPKEPLGTKGAITIALFKHYRDIGKDPTDLINFGSDIGRGAGQYNQAFSILNKFTGKDWIGEMDVYLKRKGVELPEDARADIEKKFLEAAKIKDEKAKSAAVHEIISELSIYVPFKPGEWLDAYRYTNMLFNPQSHMRNVYGNTIQALITRPLSLIARGDLSGAKTYLANAWKNALSGEAFRVAKESFKSDYSKWAESLTSPNATVFDAVRMETGPQGKHKGVAWKTLTFIPKLLNAQDKFFGSLIEAGEMARLIKKGETVADAQTTAHLLAEKYLYRERLGQNRDKSLPIFSQALDGLANLIEAGRTTENPYVRWPMKLVVPFLRTPIRIAQMSVESSPLAWIGSGMNVERIAKSKYGKSFEILNREKQLLVKEEFNNRVGLASVGTMVTLMGVGAAIQGNTTWGAPQDPTTKKWFYASGRRPYSFRVGNRWIPMAYLGPFFLAFALPAAARDAFADNPASVDESMITRLGLAAAGIPKIILSQTPVSGVNGLLEALQGKIDKNVAAAIGFEGAQFIPASGLLRWVNKIVDPVYRHPVSISETIKSGVPGLSKDLKAYLDVNNKDAGRPWTDVYLPYTISKNDAQKELMFQRNISQLKAKIKLKNILNENKEKVRKASLR
jgi:hypothetical protein